MAAGLPLANELFDFKLDLLSQGDMRRLARIREDWARWKEENPNGLAEQFIVGH